MIRTPRPGEEAAIDAFLARRPDTTMFLRGNLARHGLSGSDAPHAMRYHLQERAGAITGVFARSNAGFVMAEAASDDPELTDELAGGLARAMAGGQVAGYMGRPEMAALIETALGLNDAACALKAPEPLYRLNLDQMTPPPGPAPAIRPPEARDIGLLTAWNLDYETTTLGAPDTADTRARAARDARRAVAEGDTRLLIEAGRPTARTAFNARAGDMVQVGAVYVPPPLRRAGRARRLLAAHLAQAHARGVRGAVLFASGAAAARSYEALGFARTGSYVLAILATPARIPATTGAAP